MNLFYNPFLPVNEHSLAHLVKANLPYVVIQRFEWPGLTPQKAFLLSAYAYTIEAQEHAHELREKEGKAANLLIDAERDKIVELVKTGSGFSVFFNGTIDRKHEKRLQEAYRKSVYDYIKFLRLKKEKEEQYFVRIFVAYGRVMAEVGSSHGSKIEPFINMIK